MNDSKVALALVECNELKPSKANVDMVREAVQAKCFVPLNSVVSLRESSRHVLIPGKIDYQLQDGSWIALDVDTNNAINSLLKEQDSFDDVLSMTTRQGTFLAKLRVMIKEKHGQ
jgi:hypothetical protein